MLTPSAPQFWSASALGRLLNLDRRTLVKRIERLRVEPEAFDGRGNPLYSERTRRVIEQEIGPGEREALAELRREAIAILTGPKPETLTSTTI